MAPRHEPLKTKDGRSYTLWANINDAMSAIIPAYWSNSRERRKARGWMFRGQRNSDWDLIPSLYRPPLDDATFKARKDYTDAFIKDLVAASARLGLPRLPHSEYLAIAQHYGFYTPLLDFTWNAEVAAYFATLDGERGEAGIIFAFSLSDYQGMRNPFAALGSSVEESDEIFKKAGMESLPDLELIELYNVPRIYEQEGLFIRVTPEKIETLLHECIDRFYFRQRTNTLYAGNFAHKEHTIPERHDFDTDATYEAFLELLREEQPHVFDRTEEFGATTLFPPADPISIFAERWKQEHPDPLMREKSKTKSAYITPPRENVSLANSFAEQIDRYYESDHSRSPYESQYLLKGRELVESLGENSELANPEVQRWLLWELLKRNVPKGLKCTLKLGNAQSWGSAQQGFQFTVVDRWLADSFQYTLTLEQLQNEFCQVIFGQLSSRGRPEITVRTVAPFTPPRTLEKPVPSNPHKGSHARDILHEVESRLVGVKDGVVGSFFVRPTSHCDAVNGPKP